MSGSSLSAACLCACLCVSTRRQVSARRQVPAQAGGRQASPSKIKALVTNLTELIARQVLSIYKRRWPIEILFKELKKGLGQHQVTKDKDRVDKSVGVAIIAYLILIRARHHEIKPDQPWSIFQLKNSFTWEVYHQQIEHAFKLELKKYTKAA